MNKKEAANELKRKWNEFCLDDADDNLKRSFIKSLTEDEKEALEEKNVEALNNSLAAFDKSLEEYKKAGNEHFAGIKE